LRLTRRDSFAQESDELLPEVLDARAAVAIEIAGELVDDALRPSPEVRAIALFDADQIRDDPERERHGDLADEIDALLLEDPLHAGVGRTLDLRGAFGDGVRLERLRDEPAKPRVLRRIVHRHHGTLLPMRAHAARRREDGDVARAFHDVLVTAHDEDAAV